MITLWQKHVPLELGLADPWNKTRKIQTACYFAYQSQIISAASYRSLITMVTQRVDILIAIKLRWNCSPVFLIGVPLQKALPSAPRLITQIRVSEGEMWCHLKMCLRGLNSGRRHTFKASQVNRFLPRIGGLLRATTNSWFEQREAA